VKARQRKLNRFKFARCSPSRAEHQINHDQGSGEEKKVFKNEENKREKELTWIISRTMASRK
jgi:hypothetical protein